MYPDIELIVGYHKVNPISILQYDAKMHDLLARWRRPWRACRPLRFFARIQPQGECWLWTGAVSPSGVPRFPQTIKKVHFQVSARQLMWRWVGREAVVATTVTCGNKLCLRPSHLIAGRQNTPRQPYSASRNDAPPATNKVEFGSGPFLGEWLKTADLSTLQVGHGLPCKPAVFWFKVRVGKGGCWQWFGPSSQRSGPYWHEYVSQYRRAFPRRGQRSVVRWSGKDEGVDWTMTYTTCGNHLCVNPHHIERGIGHKYAPRVPARRRKQEKVPEPEYVDTGL